MTAREIIERRLGRKLPATADLAPDQRRAVKNLAVILLQQAADRRRAAREAEHEHRERGGFTGGV